MANFTIQVGAKVNTKQIDTQLKGYKPTITVKTALDGGGSKEVTTYTNALDKTLKVEKKLDAQGKVTSSTIKRISTNAQSASTKVGQLGKSFVSTTLKVAKFYASAMVIKAFTSAIDGAVSAVKEFDDAITEMGKVSNYSGKQLSDYAEQLGELGTTVSRTRAEMVQGATDYLKAGFSEEEASELAKVTALYQNTADEVLSASQATSVIVSQMKAFNMTADESIKIIDSINKVSADYAVSSSDIGKGLTAAGSALQTYGNSFDQTVGLVTAGTEIFQGKSQQVARGLNQVASRVAKNEEALAQYGVAVKDSNGNLRSTFDVLKDLSPKWKEMSNSEQVSLGLALAGTNQYKIFSAVMNNFNTAISATNDSLDSAGSTAKQNEVYMGSLSAKLNNLKAEFQELVLGDGGLSDFIKGLVDAGTAILKFANSDVGQAIIKLALFATALTGIIKLGKLVKETFIASSIVKWGESLALAQAGAVAGTVSLTTALGALLSTLAPFIGGAVIAGIFYAIYKGITDTEGRLKKANEALEDTKNKLSDVQSEYDKLSNKSNLNDAEKKRLKYLKEQLKVLKEQEDVDTKLVAKRTIEDYKGKVTENKKINQGGSTYDITLDVTVKGEDGLNRVINEVDALTKQYNKGKITQDEYINQTQDMVSGMDDVFNSMQSVINNGGTLTDSQQKLYNAIWRVNAQLVKNGGASKIYNNALNSLTKSTGLSKQSSIQFSSVLKEEGGVYKFVSQSAKNNAIAVVQAEMSKTKAVIQQAKARLKVYQTEIDNMNTINNALGIHGIGLIGAGGGSIRAGAKDTENTIKKAQKQYKSLQSDLKKLKSISVSVPSSTVTSGGTSGGSGSGSGGTSADTKKQKQKEKEQKALEKAQEKAKKNIEERLATLKTEDGYTKKNRESFIKYIKKERKLNHITAQERKDYLNQYYNIKASKYLEDYEKNIKSYNQMKKLLYNYVKSGKIKWSEYHEYIDELNEKSAEKAKKSLESQKDTLDKLIEKREAQQSLLEIYAQEQQDIIQKQIDALDEENDAYEKQVEYEELLANLQKAKTNRVKVYKKGEGFIYAEDTEAVKEAQKALNDFNRSQVLENQKRALEEQKNAWSDFIDNMSSAQNKWELEQKAGMTYEKLIQDSKITNLESFVSKYKELVAQLQVEQEKLNKINALQQHNEEIENKFKYVAYDSNGKAHGSNISQKRATGIAKGTITKLIPVKKSAVGSYGVKEDGATLVGDNPNYQELVIGSKLNDGSQIMNLQKGTGVIPNNLTSTLVRMASSYNSQNYKQSLANGQTLINTGNWVFPNITNSSSAENLFSEIKRLAIQESYKRG